MTPLQAIRAKCLECAGDSAYEVRLCPIVNCVLHEFRFGRRPGKNAYTDEQKEEMRRRLAQNVGKDKNRQ